MLLLPSGTYPWIYVVSSPGIPLAVSPAAGTSLGSPLPGAEQASQLVRSEQASTLVIHLTRLNRKRISDEPLLMQACVPGVTLWHRL